MECEKCNNSGLALIDVGAPFGNGCIEGYCDCKNGETLATSELCAMCGSHKDETPEKKVYSAYSSEHMFCYHCIRNLSRSRV